MHGFVKDILKFYNSNCTNDSNDTTKNIRSAAINSMISFICAIEYSTSPINLEIDTELTNEIIATSIMESRNETVL